MAPVLLAASWTRWASATFTGARHEISLSAPASDALDAWLGALPEAQWRLRWHLVADIVVASVAPDPAAPERRLVDIEVLTLEEH